MAYNELMEDALLEEEKLNTVEKPKTPVKPESGFNFRIEGLISSAEIKNFLNEIITSTTDPEEQKELLREKIEKLRGENRYVVQSINDEHAPFTEDSAKAYFKWDETKAKEILSKYSSLKELERIKDEVAKKEMEAIMPTSQPEALSEPAGAQIIEMDSFAETPEIDLDEVARKEMAEIMPITPKKSDVERYSDLVLKLEQKARELERKVTLTLDEQDRLSRIKSDAIYFSEHKKKAIAAEQEPLVTEEAPIITKDEGELTSRIEAQRTAVKEEMLKLKKKPEQEEVLQTEAPTNEDGAENTPISEVPTASSPRGWFGGIMRIFEGTQEMIEQKPPPKTIELTPQKKLLPEVPKPPLGRVGINKGVQVN